MYALKKATAAFFLRNLAGGLAILPLDVKASWELSIGLQLFLYSIVRHYVTLRNIV